MTSFLPITRDEMDRLGWDSADVILVSGDAYVDHPSFGTAVIGRLIEAQGLRVAILAQPNWRDDLRDFKKLGKPNLFFGVTGGCMDSMVNHYTAHKRKRSSDAYTPGGVAGFRPDYAVVTYSRILKDLYPEVPVILGGIEASLRRVTHFDYWSNSLKPSILVESGADMLVYGMGELPLLELLKLLQKGVPVSSLLTIPQTSVLVDQQKLPKNKNWEDVEIESHEVCLKNKEKYSRNFRTIERESNKISARRILQKIDNRYVVVNPPYPPMNERQMDYSFELPYTRLPHPKYKKRGTIPAYEMIKFSINTHRGCFGGCSFCTISAHQGKFIASRSEGSILRELEALTRHPEFKGIISDMGGPSANMYRMKGIDESICERCSAPSCIFPKICKNLDTNHGPMLDLYKKISNHPKVRKAFVGSGLRYDLMLAKDKDDDQKNHKTEYVTQLVTKHVSGRLKVAPEHTSDEVLKLMRKPSFNLFYQFKEMFDKISGKAGLKQQIIPYFISSHPGSKEENMAELAADTKDLGFELEQVQDFTPTPMTVATEIYYSGI
ncbi:MAG: YgiQ family radical SAM protein, partial [Leptospiraceae bacterium]|nr:YgiQ family radical SAM protein [Leptospiraceae bacterium]